MEMQPDLLQRDQGRTDAFRPDWDHTIRYSIKALWFFLAFLGICIFTALDGRPFPSDGITFLAALLALFGGSGELALHRRRRNSPLLLIGPAGVAFPINRVDTVSWHNVTRVKLVRISLRGARTTGVRFYFRKGTLRRWQFGALGLDRWEAILSFGNRAGTSLRVEGGVDEVIESIERFHPVER